MPQAMACRLLGTSPLPEPIMTYCQLHPKYSTNLGETSIWKIYFPSSKCLVPNIDHFVYNSTSQCPPICQKAIFGNLNRIELPSLLALVWLEHLIRMIYRPNHWKYYLDSCFCCWFISPTYNRSAPVELHWKTCVKPTSTKLQKQSDLCTLWYGLYIIFSAVHYILGCTDTVSWRQSGFIITSSQLK